MRIPRLFAGHAHDGVKLCVCGNRQDPVEVMKKMACDRLLSSFMAVAPTVRDRFPSSMIRAISAYDVTSSLALGRIQQPGGECAAWLRGAARETATHLERSST